MQLDKYLKSGWNWLKAQYKRLDKGLDSYSWTFTLVTAGLVILLAVIDEWLLGSVITILYTGLAWLFGSDDFDEPTFRDDDLGMV